MRNLIFCLITLFVPNCLLCGQITGKRDDRAASIVAELIDPAELDSLVGKRAATARLRKVAYHLQFARLTGSVPEDVIEAAQKRLGIAGTPRAIASKGALLRNLDILLKLGCLDEAGMGKLRKGSAPTITNGPYAGDIASVDHIIPRSVVEELDEKLYNLEFMPSRLNQKKGSLIGIRQIQLAKRWHKEGLLSDEGLKAVEKVASASD